MLQPLSAKSTRKLNLTDSRDRSYRNGYRQGSSETKTKMLDIFAHYCKHTLGVEPKYGENIETMLQKHALEHSL